ncbi:tRNA-binding protein [Candidatus Falkowbacteria bacterium]|mgnify:FL=1|jgi:tRNA-binding protein|nr:tRNA-binding protein [Candidatus Falkowbacteria bacterium]
MNKISWDDFEKVELIVGTIIEVNDFPEAKIPAYKIRVDFGSEIGVKISSARITELYSKEDLLNRKIIGVVNFPPKRIGPFVSEFLCSGFYREDGSVVLAVPDKDVPNGSKLG